MTKSAKQVSIEVLAQDLGAKIATTENVVTTVEISHKYDELLTKFKTKSGVVRFLDSEGFKRGQIAKFCGIRYQHVRNILVTPLKKATEEATATIEA